MHQPSFYSQHGEDQIAWKVFGKSEGPCFFVEVGVIDGVRFSNTLALERRGWRGVCIEAHPRFVEMVRKNRPGSTVIHAAASDAAASERGVVPFHADPRGDLSSLHARNTAEMKARFGGDFSGFDVVDVPARTLDDMLAKAGAPVGMEVVSIDIEGAELTALRGFDLERWKPRLLILEADDPTALTSFRGWLEPRGYKFARMVGVNALFCRLRFDAARVRLARVDQPVLHTANPMDRGTVNRVIIPSAYETKSQYVLRFGRAA